MTEPDQEKKKLDWTLTESDRTKSKPGQIKSEPDSPKQKLAKLSRAIHVKNRDLTKWARLGQTAFL